MGISSSAQQHNLTEMLIRVFDKHMHACLIKATLLKVFDV